MIRGLCDQCGRCGPLYRKEMVNKAMYITQHLCSRCNKPDPEWRLGLIAQYTFFSFIELIIMTIVIIGAIIGLSYTFIHGSNIVTKGILIIVIDLTAILITKTKKQHVKYVNAYDEELISSVLNS